MELFEYYLGIHPVGALAILISTVLLYFSFAALIAWSGQRIFSSPSSFDLAIVTVLGAIVGRAILGHVPTLSGGLIALGTLFLLELVTGRVRHMAGLRDRFEHRAVAIMVAGRPDRELMTRYSIDDSHLWAALRGAGVHAPTEAALVVLEQNGAISVVRSDKPVHPAALTGVRRANAVRVRLEEAGLMSERKEARRNATSGDTNPAQGKDPAGEGGSGD